MNYGGIINIFQLQGYGVVSTFQGSVDICPVNLKDSASVCSQCCFWKLDAVVVNRLNTGQKLNCVGFVCDGIMFRYQFSNLLATALGILYFDGGGCDVCHFKGDSPIFSIQNCMGFGIGVYPGGFAAGAVQGYVLNQMLLAIRWFLHIIYDFQVKLGV